MIKIDNNEQFPTECPYAHETYYEDDTGYVEYGCYILEKILKKNITCYGECCPFHSKITIDFEKE